MTSQSTGVVRRREPRRRLGVAVAATLCGSAVALLVFRLSWILLGRSTPITWSAMVVAAVTLAVPISLAAGLWACLAADFRRFVPPFLLSTGLPIAAVLAVSLYFRSPGEAWRWFDPEWVPWLLAIGSGSAGLALVFTRWPREESARRTTGQNGKRPESQSDT